MQDRSTNRVAGRTVTTWQRIGQNWQTSKVVQSGISQSSESFTCTNGTGGQPDRKTATAMGFTKVRTTDSLGTMFSGNPTSFYTLTEGAIAGTSMLVNTSSAAKPTLNTSTEHIRNQVISKLGERARGDLDLAIDILEGGQTLRMLRQASNIVQYIRGFSLARWSRKWLEYQYGWRPLVSSMYGAFEEVMRPPRMGRAYYKERAREVQIGRKQTVPFSGVIDTWDVNLSKRVEMKIALDFSNSTLQVISNYTSLNPASIAWELLPYSFVADWFVDIGGYLRNLENAYLLDLNFKFGYETTTTRKMEFGIRKGTQVTGSNDYTTYPGASRQIYTVTKSRGRLTGFPRTLRPTVKLDLGSQQILSGAALLHQFFQRGRR